MQLFVFVLLLSHVAMVAAVDGCHSGRDKDHRPRENCTAAGFSDVPAGFEPTTKVVLFPANLFSSLSWSSFQMFTEIYEIDLTRNKVPEVTPSVAPILPSLSVLRLGSNHLTSLSDGSFSACPALTELYLENNAIDSLSDHTFSGLSKLEILDLSSNRIRVLPLLLLHPLPAIETLILENNKIKVLPEEWFSQKEEVPYLFLSANPWACYCSLGYLRRYLDNYEHNVYVRDGPIISNNGESVVCDSPQSHKGTPVINLEESDLCSLQTESSPNGDFYQPITTHLPYKITPTNPVPTTITPTNPVPTTITPTITPTNPVPTTITPTNPVLATTPATPASEYHRVVTWSWYQTFTSYIEWSDHSGSEVRGEGSRVGSHALSTRPTLPTVRPTAESTDHMTVVALTKPAETTKAAPTTITSTMPKLQAVTTTATTEVTTASAISWVIDKVSGDQRGSQIAGAAAGGFCFWLFAGGVLLCVAAAACALATLVRLVVWYRKVYKPLRATLARRGGGEGVRLLTYRAREKQEVAGGGGGGVMTLYRSVLFVSGEKGEAEQTGGAGRQVVTLEPTGEEQKEGGMEERGVYRKVMYRLVSKQEELEGWRDVMEECRVNAEDGGRRARDGDGGVSRKRYSVILREETGEAGGGREELDWVVGGWEVKRGEGEEHRSSLGEWLANYLPSMPWGVTTPPEGDAAQ